MKHKTIIRCDLEGCFTKGNFITLHKGQKNFSGWYCLKHFKVISAFLKRWGWGVY